MGELIKVVWDVVMRDLGMRILGMWILWMRMMRLWMYWMRVSWVVMCLIWNDVCVGGWGVLRLREGWIWVVWIGSKRFWGWVVWMGLVGVNGGVGIKVCLVLRDGVCDGGEVGGLRVDGCGIWVKFCIVVSLNWLRLFGDGRRDVGDDGVVGFDSLGGWRVCCCLIIGLGWS